jgi:hypothetical protein
MKRFILSMILSATMITTLSGEALAASLNCRHILLRCIEDCREVFDIGVLKDACAFGCYIGFVNCD